MILKEYEKYYEYETVQNDNFDSMALDFYGEETKSNLIIQANPQYQDILIFDEGIKLIIPIVEVEAKSTLPPWKRKVNE